MTIGSLKKLNNRIDSLSDETQHGLITYTSTSTSIENTLIAVIFNAKKDDSEIKFLLDKEVCPKLLVSMLEYLEKEINFMAKHFYNCYLLFLEFLYPGLAKGNLSEEAIYNLSITRNLYMPNETMSGEENNESQSQNERLRRIREVREQTITAIDPTSGIPYLINGNIDPYENIYDTHHVESDNSDLLFNENNEDNQSQNNNQNRETSIEEYTNNYKLLELHDPQTYDKEFILFMKRGYDTVNHVSNLPMEGYEYDGIKRNRYSAVVNIDHPDEHLHGKKVFIKCIELSFMLETALHMQAFREVMIGMQVHHPLINKIIDNWVVLEDGRPRKIYIVYEDLGGKSIKHTVRKGAFKRSRGTKCPVSLSQFLKIAQDCFTALIVLKKHGIVHRDLSTSNVLIHDINDPDGPRCEIQDFAWPRKIFGPCDHVCHGPNPKFAPEISLRSKDYTNKISENGYSYPSDIFSLAQTLCELLEYDEGFMKTFGKKIIRFQMTGNTRIDDIYSISFINFSANRRAEEYGGPNSKSYKPMGNPRDNYTVTEEQIEHMKVTDPHCQIPDHEKYQTRLEKFLGVNGKHGTLNEGDSIMERYLRNFWFRYLDHSKGWTDEARDLLVDMILKMLNYWPENRPTCEELYNHPIFQLSDKNGGKLLKNRTDIDDINYMIEKNDEGVGKGNVHFKEFTKQVEAKMHNKDYGQEATNKLTTASGYHFLTLEQKKEGKFMCTNARSRTTFTIHKILDIQSSIKIKRRPKPSPKTTQPDSKDVNNNVDPKTDEEYLYVPPSILNDFANHHGVLDLSQDLNETDFSKLKNFVTTNIRNINNDILDLEHDSKQESRLSTFMTSMFDWGHELPKFHVTRSRNLLCH